MNKFLILYLLSFFVLGSAVSQGDLEKELSDINELILPSKITYSDTSLVLNKLKEIEKNYLLTDCENWYQYHRVLVKFYYNLAWIVPDSDLFYYYFDENIRLNKKSISKIIECYGLDHENLARTYFNIGNAYYNIYEDVEASEFYDLCLEVDAMNNQPSDKVCDRMLFIGDFHSDINSDPDRGLEILEVALNKLPKENPERLKYFIYRSQARSYREKVENDKAIKLYNKAIQIAKVIDPKFDNIETSRDYEEISVIQIDEGEIESAFENIARAIEILEMYHPDRTDDIRRQKIKQAKIISSQGRFEEVNFLLDKALLEIGKPKTNKDLWDISYALRLKGENLDDWGKNLEAAKAYQKAMGFLSTSVPKDLLKNPQIEGNKFLIEDQFKDLLMLKANSLMEAYKMNKNQNYFISACDALLKMDSVINQSFLKNFNEGSYQSGLVQTKPGYENGIKANLELFHLTKDKMYVDEAYRFTSKFKSRLLARGINIKTKEEEILTKNQKNVVDSLRDIISEVRNEIQIAALDRDTLKQRKLYEETLGYEEQLKKYQKDNNVYNLLSIEDLSKSYSVSDIQKEINSDEAIIEYHLADSILYSFAITKDEFLFTVNELPVNITLDFYGAISQGRKMNSENLSSALFDVVEKMNIKKIRKVIIIPDGDLLQVPFEALTFDDNLLLETFNVSYEYSSAFLFDKQSTSSSRDLTAFASDYTAGSFDSLHNNKNYGDEGIHLSTLNNTIDEVRIANSLFKGQVFENEKATKSNFEKNAADNNILHLALHGVINNEIPDQSALVFSSTNGDHLLTASEIYNMEINNDLTILSACNTGVGPVKVGDGVRSMARSFIHAGSESVMTSLWEISDVTTKKILKSFYTYLHEGKTKSESLRQAKLDFINQASPTQRHPKYWAHLILIGDPGEIQVNAGGNLKYIVFASALVVLLITIRLFSSKMKRDNSEN